MFSSLTALHFALAIRTSRRVAHTLTSNVQLRRLLWLQALWLPLLTVHFMLATYATNRTLESPFQALSALSLAIGVGVLAAQWATNAALRVRAGRTLQTLVFGTRPLSDDSLTGTRTSVLMHSKQQISSSHMTPAMMMTAGSSATLPSGSAAAMTDNRWASASVCGYGNSSPTGVFNASLQANALDASTTTTTSRSTTSRVGNHQHHRRRRHRKRAPSSQSGGDLTRMLDDPHNYIDPYGYFSYDNDGEDDFDGEDGGAMADDDRSSVAKHRRTHHRHGGRRNRKPNQQLVENSAENWPEDQEGQPIAQTFANVQQMSSNNPYATFGEETTPHQILGSNIIGNEYINLPSERLAAMDAQDAQRTGTLQRTLHQHSGQLLDHLMNSNQNSNYALYSVPQSLVAPPALYSNVHASVQMTASNLQPNLPAGSRANIFSMMQTASGHEQSSQSPRNAQQPINYYSGYVQPRLVDYSVRDDDEEEEREELEGQHSQQPQPQQYQIVYAAASEVNIRNNGSTMNTNSGSVYSGSTERNNEVTEIVENI